MFFLVSGESVSGKEGLTTHSARRRAYKRFFDRRPIADLAAARRYAEIAPAALWRAGVTTGVLLPRPPYDVPPVIRGVQQFHRAGAGWKLLWFGAVLAALFVLAFPAGLLLAWRPARERLALEVRIGLAAVPRLPAFANTMTLGAVTVPPVTLLTIESPATVAKLPAPLPEKKDRWLIGAPDLVIQDVAKFKIPSQGIVPYKYSILPYV